MRGKEKKFRLDRPGYEGYDGFPLRMIVRDQDGTTREATNITLEILDERSVISPLMILQREDCQSLMDELWSCGIRPAEAKYNTESFKAIQYHLEDMRSLVFKGRKP